MILVTAATGQLGSKIVEQLLARVPAEQAAVSVRDAEKAAGLAARGVSVRQADYDDVDSLNAAFAGVDTLMLISADGPNEARIAQHRNAIAAAKTAGVKRIVYTSYVITDPASPFDFVAIHHDTEAAIRDSGIEWTFLRNGLYADLLLMGLAPALEQGALAMNAADGKVAMATRGDLAEAAAVVLAEDGHAGKSYALTGPELLGYADIAAIISEVHGKPVAYAALDDDTMLGIYRQIGLPEFLAVALANNGRALAQGDYEVLGDDLGRLLGREPTSVRELLLAAKG
jgi:NAD(P)H dehydrogenase (quinone)